MRRGEKEEGREERWQPEHRRVLRVGGGVRLHHEHRGARDAGDRRGHVHAEHARGPHLRRGAAQVPEAGGPKVVGERGGEERARVERANELHDDGVVRRLSRAGDGTEEAGGARIAPHADVPRGAAADLGVRVAGVAARGVRGAWARERGPLVGAPAAPAARRARAGRGDVVLPRAADAVRGRGRADGARHGRAGARNVRAVAGAVEPRAAVDVGRALRARELRQERERVVARDARALHARRVPELALIDEARARADAGVRAALCAVPVLRHAAAAAGGEHPVAVAGGEREEGARVRADEQRGARVGPRHAERGRRRRERHVLHLHKRALHQVRDAQRRRRLADVAVPRGRAWIRRR